MTEPNPLVEDQPRAEQMRQAGERITMGYAVEFDEPPDADQGSAAALTAAAREHTGAMIALIPSDADLDRLVLDGGEPREELHLTLAYLGEAADWSEGQQQALHDGLQSPSLGLPEQPIEAAAFGAAHWNPTSEYPAWVLNVGGGDLEGVHGAVWELLRNQQGEQAWPIPENHIPWSAHVCISYDADLGLLAAMEERLGPLVFDRLRVAFAGENHDIPLAARRHDEEDTTVTAPTTDADVETEVALQTGDDAPTVEVEPADTPLPAPVPAVEHFHTVVTEGVSTGMRTFVENALTWREPPFAYHWQYGSAAHGGMPLTVQVGLITRVERDGNDIHFYGTLDLRSDKGLEYARQLAEGWARWSSIGLDEEKVEVELVWPEGADDGDPMEAMFEEPEQYIIHSGNIGEVSAVSVPALADATVEPTQALIDELEVMGVVVASAAEYGAVARHETGTTDDAWDGPANERRLPSPMSLDTARGAYAWYDSDRVSDGEIVKDACSFIHHHVGENGQPGVANLNACSTGIAVLNGGMGVNVAQAEWAGDRRGIWNHLAGHLRDAGREPPELRDMESEVEVALTAASHTIVIHDVPPGEWFDEPTDVTPEGALTVTDEGRIYGYVAPSGVAHRAFKDRRVEVPMGRVDYGRWMGGEALVAGGGRVVAGPITMECGHASPFGSADPAVRMEHYDNTCAVVAKARVGENRHGVWIAGALEPGVSADQISRMMACRLSGDWAPHPERRGWMEFCAALLVPVPGFAQGRSAPSVTVRDGVMVASAVPVQLRNTTSGATSRGRVVLETLARSIGRDTRSRMAALRSQVHTSTREQ